MSSLRVLDFPCEGAGALLRNRRLRLELRAEVGSPPDAADDGDVAEHDGEVRRHLHHDNLAPEGIGRAAYVDGGGWLVLWKRNIFSLSLQSRFVLTNYKYRNIVGVKFCKFS